MHTHLSLYSFLAAFVLVSGIGGEAPAIETLANGWNAADVGIGTKPAFDFGPDGRIHILSMIEDFSGGVDYDVADSADGPWNLERVSTGYYYGPADLRVDASGTVHMGWHNHNDPGPNHFTIDSVGTETLYHISTPGHSGWDNALAIDNAGTVHMTSIFPSSFGATDSLEYGTFDGSSWQVNTVPGSGEVMYGLATSLAFDSQDQPHTAYNLATGWATPGDLNYAYQDGAGWHVSTVSTGGVNGRFPSIAVDSLDRPHIAWLDIDEADNGRGFVQYGVLDDGVWSIEPVATLEHIELGFSGGRKQVSLVLDENDVPHLAYGDRQTVVYATNSGSGWGDSTVLASDADLYNGMVVLRLDSNSDPVIAFWQDHPTDAGLIRLVALAPSLAADFDSDGDVDGDDFLAWQTGFGTPAGAQKSDGDYDNDGDVDGDDFLGWQIEFGSSGNAAAGTIPEPSSAMLGLAAIACSLSWRRRR